MAFRLAATGDLHCRSGFDNGLRATLEDLNDRADALLICGDLTARGRMSELEKLIGELSEVRVPILAILGNHDYHQENQRRFKASLAEVGITTLDGASQVLQAGEVTVGVAGTKGFAGGFGLRALPDFGEDLWRRMYAEILAESEKLRSGLETLDAQVKVAATHYAPIPATLAGEDPQIYPFLGSSMLSEAIDRGGADLALHGHSHYGREEGTTPGGVPVHNVSIPVTRNPYRIFDLPVR